MCLISRPASSGLGRSGAAAMIAIAVIVTFLVVVFALNAIDFRRLD
jgi:hypothetical protein